MRLYSMLLLSVAATPVLFGQVTQIKTGFQFRQKLTAGSAVQFDVTHSEVNEGQSWPKTMLPVAYQVDRVNGQTANASYLVGKLRNNVRRIPVEVSPLTLLGGSNSVWKLGSLTYSSTPVKVGASWTTSVLHPKFGEEIRINFTFERIATLGGHKVAELKLVSNESRMEGHHRGSGQAWVRMSDGSLQGLEWNEEVALVHPRDSMKTMRSSLQTKIKRLDR